MVKQWKRITIYMHVLDPFIDINRSVQSVSYGALSIELGVYGVCLQTVYSCKLVVNSFMLHHIIFNIINLFNHQS